MNLKIIPNGIKGKIIVPPSKSVAHRVIILAGILGKNVRIKNVGCSNDILATIECLKIMGSDMELKDNVLLIRGFNKKDGVILNCYDSGSTLRFLLPVCSVLGQKAQFIGSDRLLIRPITELIDCLNRNGARIEDFEVKGKADGDYSIDASKSSQFVSGLLMALSLSEEESRITLKGKTVSADYINVTLDLLRKFGKKIEKTNDGYIIKKSKMIIPKEITVEGDFSSSAFYLSAGALGEGVTISGLNVDTAQGDRRIVEILKDFGAKVDIADGITVRKGKLKGIETDVDGIPDLAPVIAVVGAFAEGKTVLKNVDRLRYKESDRVASVTAMLESAGINCYQEDGSLIIEGGNPKGGVFQTFSDHRIAMASVILATFASGSSVITDGEAVAKSYPDFYYDYEKLGGKADVVI